ncbi:hypothetical protein DRN85_09555 [Methanosarcinales archaeon]|nr:MAG: hypothetical protein DRN85_09555 [Methanosarcinales archaeon]
MKVKACAEYETAGEARRKLPQDYQRGVRKFRVPYRGSRIELEILQEHRVRRKPHLVMIFSTWLGRWVIRVYPNGSMKLRMTGIEDEDFILRAHKSPKDGFYFRTGLDVLLRKLCAVLVSKSIPVGTDVRVISAVMQFLAGVPSWFCNFLHDVAVQWFDLMAMDRATLQEEE